MTKFKNNHPHIMSFMVWSFIVLMLVIIVTILYSVCTQSNYSNNHILRNLSFVLENISYIISILGFTSVILGILQYGYSRNEENGLILDKTHYLIKYYFENVIDSIEVIKKKYNEILISRLLTVLVHSNKDKLSDLNQNTRKVIQFSARMASLKDSHIITACFRNLEEWSNRVNEGVKVHLIDEDNIFGEAHNEVMSVLKDYKPAIEKLGFINKYRSCYQLFDRWSNRSGK